MPERRVLEYIPVEIIEHNPHQPRKHFDQDALNELELSIREYGVLEPILLRKAGGSILLVAGERRLRAAQSAGLDRIPAIFIKEHPEEIALIENLLRENLTVIEEAEAIGRIMSEHDYGIEDLEKILGKSRQTIRDILLLTSLPQVIRDECRNNPKCSRRVLVEIARKKQERSKLSLYRKYKEQGLTSDELRQLRRNVGPRKVALEVTMERVEDLRQRLAEFNLANIGKKQKAKFRASLTSLKELLDSKLGEQGEE